MKVSQSNTVSNHEFNVDVLILEAKKQMKLLNYKKAYEILKTSIDRGLIHSDIFYLFGEICRITKYLDESEFYLLESLKFEHHSPFVLFSLGLLNYEMQQFKLAKNFFKNFLEVLEDSAETHFFISKCYVYLKKYLKAITHLSKAIEINPEHSEYHEFLGKIYEIVGINKQAIQDLRHSKENKK